MTQSKGGAGSGGDQPDGALALPGESMRVLPFTGKQSESRDGGSYLREVPRTKCNHYRGPFEVDPDAAKCKCLTCGEEVSAIFVLKELMRKESQWMRTRAAYLEDMKRLAERSKTKCEHCHKMTRISRR